MFGWDGKIFASTGIIQLDDVGVLQCGASGDERFFTILASEICRKISEFEGKPLLGLMLLSWKAGLNKHAYISEGLVVVGRTTSKS